MMYFSLAIFFGLFISLLYLIYLKIKEKQRLEKQHLEKVEKERLEKQRLKRVEKERLEKVQKERLEKERLEKVEKERLEKERLEKVEKERLKKERLEKVEKEHLEKERLEKVEKERLEKQRLEKVEKERLEKQRLKKVEKERLEKERLEKVEKENDRKNKLKYILSLFHSANTDVVLIDDVDKYYYLEILGKNDRFILFNAYYSEYQSDFEDFLNGFDFSINDIFKTFFVSVSYSKVFASDYLCEPGNILKVYIPNVNHYSRDSNLFFAKIDYDYVNLLFEFDSYQKLYNEYLKVEYLFVDDFLSYQEYQEECYNEEEEEEYYNDDEYYKPSHFVKSKIFSNNSVFAKSFYYESSAKFEIESYKKQLDFFACFYYVPKRYGDLVPEPYCSNRNKVFDFKTGRNTSDVAYYVASAIYNKFLDTKWLNSDTVFVIIPSSKKDKNRIRFYSFVEIVSSSLGLVNGFNVISRVYDRNSTQEGGRDIDRTDGLEYDAEMIFNKNIIMFDDVITQGNSMVENVKILKRKGAKDVLPIFLAETYFGSIAPWDK